MLDILDTVEIFNGDKFLSKVLTLELVVGAVAKDALLLELTHKYILHLAMSQLAIVVQAQSLDTTLIVLIQFNLVFQHLDACFEHTFVLDCLSDLDLASVRANKITFAL